MNAGDHGGPDGRPKPGARTQWRKGQTGNPKGRPKKASAAATSISAEVNDMIISECEREVTLFEGGKPFTMKVSQAVIRATALSALKGNSNAQRTILQLATAAQAQAAKVKREEYERAILLKVELETKRGIWLAQGIAEKEMPWHPSDLEINRQTMTVTDYLLYTDEELQARKKAIALRDYLLDQLPIYAQTAVEDGDDLLLETGREHARNIIKAINKNLPPRFRQPLPGDVAPLPLGGSPEGLWRHMIAELASRLIRTR